MSEHLKPAFASELLSTGVDYGFKDKMAEGEVKKVDNVAFIQLQGEPYQRHVGQGADLEIIDCNLTLNSLAQSIGYEQSIPGRVQKAERRLGELFEGDGYYGLDKKIKHGQDLTFDEAYSLGAFVCAALNKPLRDELSSRIVKMGNRDTHLLQATVLFAAMSTKEAYVGLTAEEIAGLVASVVELDTVVRVESDEPVLAFGGMGGDRGYPLNGENSKLFSLSTLSAVALANEGAVHKHHSYPNTSKLAGQSAIEAFGARSDFHTQEAFQSVLKDTNLLMSSCHDTRTLHSLSHLLKGETVNHIIGPLAFTVSPETEINGFIGVNEKVHPTTMIEAMKILSTERVQKYGNSAVYCGTDLENVPHEMLDEESYMKNAELKERVRIDEVAPFPFASIVSFLVNGENMGAFEIRANDFMNDEDLSCADFMDLLIANDPDQIMETNRGVLAGADVNKIKYLAMTVGLGLFTRFCAGQPGALDRDTRRVNRQMLQSCTKYGFDLIAEGKAEEKMMEYVSSTRRYAGEKNLPLQVPQLV